MHIVLGPFHPHLEDALAREFRTLRARDRLAPLLLVVPSETLRRRVKTLLAHEHGLCLLNTHIFTFSRLALNLFHEARGPEQPPLRDQTFMEEALKRLLPDHGRFARIADNEGGCASLWQTLRDLKDAMVDPETALDGLREGLFDGRDRNALRALFELHRDVTRCFPVWRAWDHQDLDRLAADRAQVSRWLGRFAHIAYYGFYELTQTQMELFRAIAAACPVTLFYPLVQGHPDWSFAQDFFDRYLRGLAGADAVVDLGRGGGWHPSSRPTGAADEGAERRRASSGNGAVSRGPAPDGVEPNAPERDTPERPEPDRTGVGGGPAERGPAPAPAGRRIEVLSCAGQRDEVLTVAKQLLRLAEEEHLDFRRAGVAARTLDPYLPWIREIFPAHGIPFHTPAREPLHRVPRVRAVMALLDLPARDYARAAVIDLLASPHFNFAGVLHPRARPRTDLWDIATRFLGIGRGMDEWRRLERCRDTGLALNLVDHEQDGRRLYVGRWQVADLLHTVEALHADLSALPREGAWSDLAARWRALVDRFLMPAGPDDSDADAARALDAAFEGLAALDAAGGRTTLPEFTAALRRSLERGSMALMRVPVAGVQVLDAAAARGIPFRALFLVGMNEGVFPRTIREDPFLPDRARRVLETVLGCKISSKLAGYDEEKLLFALLSGAAAERLCCTWPRVDAAGRAQAPSWYLRGIEPRSIPKGVLDKRAAPPFDDPRWLLPEELAVRQALSGGDPRPPARIAGASIENLEKSLAAIRALDDGAEDAGPFDGATGALPDAWDRLREQGVSPTTLETYGICPFRYFTVRVLGLERLERPERKSPVQALEEGQICHEILQGFYDNLDRAFGADWVEWLDRVADQVLSAFEEHNPTGRPAEWETVGDGLRATLRKAVELDRAEMDRSGFRPVRLETDLAAVLDADWPEDLRGLPLQGRLDRVDRGVNRDGARARYRVIDYKYKGGKNPQSLDEAPLRAALRGYRLQLPLYLLLATGGGLARETNEGTGAGPGIRRAADVEGGGAEGAGVEGAGAKGPGAAVATVSSDEVTRVVEDAGANGPGAAVATVSSDEVTRVVEDAGANGPGAEGGSARETVAEEPGANGAWYFLAPRWDKGPLVIKRLTGEEWRESDGAEVRNTVARLLRGIRDGEFPMMPNEEDCRHCQVSEICRKDHFPSVRRAARHPAAAALTAIRQKQPRKKQQNRQRPETA